MSMLKKFLNTSATISGLIALSLVTIPYAEAAPKGDRSSAKASKQSAVGRLTNRIRTSKSTANPRASRPTAVRARPAVRNNRISRPAATRMRPAVRNNQGNRSAIQARTSNSATARMADRIRARQSATRTTNRASIRSQSNNSAVRNSNGFGSAIRNVGRDAAAINNRGSRAAVRTNNRNRSVINGRRQTSAAGNRNSRGFGSVVRNVGRDAYNVRNPGNGGVINRDDRPVAINKNRGNRGYRYRNNRYRGGGFVPGFYTGGLAYSAYNSHNYYDNYYSSQFSIGHSYGYGYPYYGYGPSWGWGSNYYYRPRTKVVYIDRPVDTVVTAAPAYIQQPQQQVYDQQPQFEDESCLQVREYTTTIEIGGESVPAYGNACLMPDGSWKFGDPIAEPSY